MTLISILAEFNCAVVWMVSILHLISSSVCLFSRSLGTIRKALVTISITVTFSFFSCLARSMYLFVFSVFFLSMLYLLVINTRCVLLVGVWQSVCVSKPQRISCISFSWRDSGLCIYHLSAWSNFNLLLNFLRITFLTQSRLVLYSFWASSLHFLIIWLSVASMSLYYHITHPCSSSTYYQFLLK